MRGKSWSRAATFSMINDKLKILKWIVKKISYIPNIINQNRNLFCIANAQPKSFSQVAFGIKLSKTGLWMCRLITICTFESDVREKIFMNILNAVKHYVFLLLFDNTGWVLQSTTFLCLLILMIHHLSDKNHFGFLNYIAVTVKLPININKVKEKLSRTWVKRTLIPILLSVIK